MVAKTLIGGLWSEPSSFSPAGVPLAGDTVTCDASSPAKTYIDIPVACTSILGDPGYTGELEQLGLNNVVLSGGLIFDGGSFLGSNSFTLDENGDIDQKATVDVDGDVWFKSGTNLRLPKLLRSEADASGNEFRFEGDNLDHNGGEVEIYGSNHNTIFTNAGNPIYKVTINTCPTCAHSGDYHALGTINFIENGIINAQIYAYGAVIGKGSTGGSGRIRLQGSDRQDLNIDAVPGIINQKTGGKTYVNKNIKFGTRWENETTDKVYIWNGYKAEMDNTSTHGDIVNGIFHTLDFFAKTTGDISLNGTDCIVKDDLIFTDIGGLNSGTFKLHGNLISNDTNIDGSAVIEIVGDKENTTYTGTGEVGNDIIVNKPQGKSLELLDDLNLDETGKNFTVVSGRVQLNDNLLYVRGNFTMNEGTSFNGGTGQLNCYDFYVDDNAFFVNSTVNPIIQRGDNTTIKSTAEFVANAGFRIGDNTGPTHNMRVAGADLVDFYFWKGAFSLDSFEDFRTSKSFEFDGNGGQMRGGGTHYWSGTYITRGQRGGAQNTRTICVGEGDNLLDMYDSKSDRAIHAFEVNEDIGALTIRSDNGDAGFDDDLLFHCEPHKIKLDNVTRFWFTNQSQQGNWDVKTNGFIIPAIYQLHGAWDMAILNDIEIAGLFHNSGSFTSSQIIGGGFKFKLHGDYLVGNRASSVSLANSPEWHFIGLTDQHVDSNEPTNNRMHSGIVRVNKKGGCVVQDSNIEIDNGITGDNGQNHLYIDKGVWFTNGFDLHVDGNIVIAAGSKLQYTSGDSVTATGTITGTQEEVVTCSNDHPKAVDTILNKRSMFAGA